uniref:ribosomal protein L22 n=1 Tax=Selenicereus megalanthus TaxID=1195127 RepID=UPI0030E51623
MKKIRGTYAFARYIPMSAHKAQRVINQIRGRSYEEAILILQGMTYRASNPILNLIQAAAANSEHNREADRNRYLDTTELIISKVEVNKATNRKKLKPLARGRNSTIKRPTCHITIVLQKPFFSVQLRNYIFPLSEKDPTEMWYAGNCSNSRMLYAPKFSNSSVLDYIIFKLIMRGALKIY